MSFLLIFFSSFSLSFLLFFFSFPFCFSLLASPHSLAPSQDVENIKDEMHKLQLSSPILYSISAQIYIYIYIYICISNSTILLSFYVSFSHPLILSVSVSVSLCAHHTLLPYNRKRVHSEVDDKDKTGKQLALANIKYSQLKDESDSLRVQKDRLVAICLTFHLYLTLRGVLTVCILCFLYFYCYLFGVYLYLLCCHLKA